MKKKKVPKVRLIVSDKDCPQVRLEPGMQFKVEEFHLADEQLKNIPKKFAARLCGGGGTCLALINIDTLSDPTP